MLAAYLLSILCLLGLFVNAHFLFRDVGHCRERGHVSVCSWCARIINRPSVPLLTTLLRSFMGVMRLSLTQLRIIGNSHVPGNANVLPLPKSVLKETCQWTLWFSDLALFNEWGTKCRDRFWWWQWELICNERAHAQALCHVFYFRDFVWPHQNLAWSVGSPRYFSGG